MPPSTPDPLVTMGSRPSVWENMFIVNVPPATGVSATVVDGATVVDTPVPLLLSGDPSSSSPQAATKTEIAKNTPATRAARITDPPVKFSIAQRATPE